MLALTKVLRLQPCMSLASLRTQAARALVLENTQHQATARSLTWPAKSSWLISAPRYFSTSHTSRNQVETETAPLETQPSEAQTRRPIRTLFIGNIPSTVGTSDLNEMFEPFGKLAGVRIKYDLEGRHAGYAHIDFHSVEDATTVYQSGQEEPFFLVDRALTVDYARRPFKHVVRNDAPRAPPSKTLFVGNLPYSTDVSQVQELFAQFGRVLNVRLNSKNGFAHIDFMEEGDAVAAFRNAEENPFSMDGRVLKIDYAVTMVVAPKANSTNTEFPRRTLFVRNIPYSLTLHDIQECFSQYGELAGVRMRYGADGGHLGFAFVDFIEVEDARAARESAQEKPIVLSNRALNVGYAIRSSKRAPPSNKLFFEDFAGGTNDLREALKKYMQFIERIDFIPSRDENTRYKRGHIIFSTEQVAKDVLNEFNGIITENGHRLSLDYAMKPRERTWR
ncbi:hypothetical protein AX15_006862 [Amanita polypyramis BW_CC]|nr:hypothetical protein AX15_006862 [Amanita polypyramis BW_CC]